jgi:hypothetical protein
MTAGTFLKALCRSFSDGIVLACTLTIIARNLGRMFKSFNSLFFPPIISEKGLHKPGEGLCSPFHYFGTDTPSNVKHWAGGGKCRSLLLHYNKFGQESRAASPAFFPSHA